MTINPHKEDTLILWFREALEAAGPAADWQSQIMDYDNGSDYDRLCAQLIQRADQVWRLKYGIAPTPGQLQKALWAAEFARSREQRQQQPAPRWWQRWLGRR